MENFHEKKMELRWLSLNPLTRFWVEKEIKNNVALPKEVVIKANLKEGLVYRGWLNQALENMRKMRLNSIEDWVVQLSKDIELGKVYSIIGEAKKQYAITEDKKLTKMLGILDGFNRSVKRFKEVAQKEIAKGVSIENAISFASDYGGESQVEFEDKIFIKQSLKRIHNLLERGEDIPLSLFDYALVAKYPDYSILNKQINALHRLSSPVFKTEHKEHIYAFIKKVTLRDQFLRSELLILLLKENWVSKRTFELLEAIKPMVVKNKMQGLVTSKLRKIIPELKGASLKHAESLLESYTD